VGVGLAATLVGVVDDLAEVLEEEEIAVLEEETFVLVEEEMAVLEELALVEVITEVAEMPSNAVASTKVPFTPAVIGITVARAVES
jgi:hypothetical protein